MYRRMRGNVETQGYAMRRSLGGWVMRIERLRKKVFLGFRGVFSLGFTWIEGYIYME